MTFYNTNPIFKKYIQISHRPGHNLKRIFMLFPHYFLDSRNGEVLNVDVKSLKDLTKEGEKVDFNPAKSLGMVSNNMSIE